MISGDRALASGKKGAFFNTLEELHRHFDRIDVICPKVPVHRFDMVLFGNVHVHPSPWPLLFQPLWILRKGREVIRHSSLDIRHWLATVHEYPPFYNGIGAWLLHRATKIPYVLEVMHVPGWPRASGVKEIFYRWLMRLFIARDARNARAVRVINERQTAQFLEAAGVPRLKLLYAPAFYIDVSTFKPYEVGPRKQYDVTFVGRMATNKGLDIFLDVMERTGLVGVAIGEGPMLEWARSESKRRGLKIHFPGFAKDSAEVARYLNESRLLLMPSLNEGGPRVVLEAMACGIPVVATPVGIVPDVLPPECIEEWNPADIADKVTNILGDSELYTRLREHGIATAQRFERTSAVSALANALKRLTQ
jgi:glycosyltransferase involved in cell wall biosynthesis